MFKRGDIVDIKMQEGEFIGVVGYFGGSSIELKEVVMAQPVADKPGSVQFINTKNTLVFYGNMVVLVLDEKHPYYVKYKESISGLILPGHGRFNN